MDELIETIDRCYSFFQNSADRVQKKLEAARERLMTLLEERLVKAAVAHLFPNCELNDVAGQIADRKLDPYSVVDEVIRKLRFT